MTNLEKWVLNSLLPFLFFGFCTSIDTITPNHSIKDGDSLVSKGEIFTLGFFSPGNSSLRYVGIWYNKVSEQTILWVANRDNPINGTTGVLSINQDGNLAISETNQNVTVWKTNVLSVAVTTNSYSAQLLDSGNLVLLEGDNGGSIVAWQSFDYPTHTMLPNMKLGLDRRTGLNRFLTSWKSRDDPGTGEDSFRLDSSGLPQLVLYKGLVRVWRSGPWIGNAWTGISEMTPDFILNASYVDNNDELYFMYGLFNASILSIMFLDESGYLQWVIWHEGNRKWIGFWSAPKDRCDNYGWCGAYGNCDPKDAGVFECKCLPGYEPRSTYEWNLRDGSNGCVRNGSALDMCKEGEGFLKVARAKIPDTSSLARAEMRLSLEACQEECLRNCSCSGFTSGVGGECVTWYGNLTDTRVFSGGGLDLYIRVDALELAQQSKKSRSFNGKKVAAVATTVVVVLLLIISLVCCLVMKKRRRGLDIRANDEENLELPIFDLATITEATNQFSNSNKIGEGGFGPVYKGQLSSGQEIAVKRLSMNSKQGLDEFKSEVILIAKLQHRNLVRLLGCCIHGEERILIYEYMINGSLDSFIFGPKNIRKSLAWKRRFDIVIGIARGLLYLHQDSRLRVIHRDLKVSNVLLDSEMNPKISDFGLARTFTGDQSSAITGRVVGTYGYMSPEYVVDGLFSMKSDVFSFGVIVLEITSGKRNRLFHHANHDFNLLGHAWKLWTEGKASELLDPLMEGTFSMSDVLRCIQVGLLCVQKHSEDRPTMSSVLLMLVTESAMLPQPKQPGFYTERSSDEARHLQAECISNTNEMTMTHLEAR